VLIIIFSRSDCKDKLRMVLNLLDFERKKHFSLEALSLVASIFVTAISRLFVIRMSPVTNKDFAD